MSNPKKPERRLESRLDLGNFKATSRHGPHLRRLALILDSVVDQAVFIFFPYKKYAISLRSIRCSCRCEWIGDASESNPNKKINFRSRSALRR